MNGIGISIHPDYPCSMVLITSDKLGELAQHIFAYSNKEFWGYCDEMLINRNLINYKSDFDLKVKYSIDGFNWETRSISIPTSSINNSLIVGIMSNGEICLWDKGNKESILVSRRRPTEIQVDTDIWYKKYNYRFIYNSDNIDDKVVKLKIDRFDGTFEELVDNQNVYMHSALPRRFLIAMSLDKGIMNMYFWMDFELIHKTICKIVGVHPETKIDVIIRIDAANKTYELALYRQGLKEPVVIPKSAYQLIVFKNKFEDYRSENYNQPRGAWIW